MLLFYQLHKQCKGSSGTVEGQQLGSDAAINLRRVFAGSDGDKSHHSRTSNKTAALEVSA